MATSPNNAALLTAVASDGTKPPEINATAAMAPILAAGVDLAQRMIGLLAGALVILVLLLALSECSEQQKANTIVDTQLRALEAAMPQAEVPGLAPVVATLRRAAQEPGWVVPTAEASALDAMVRRALENGAITPAQRADLQGKCTPVAPVTATPTPAVATPDRATTLTRCGATLEAVLGKRDASDVRFAHVQALTKAIADDRAAHRAFWLQVAQLILINLLLPILTALLGYIFGTQQGSKAT